MKLSANLSDTGSKLRFDIVIELANQDKSGRSSASLKTEVEKYSWKIRMKSVDKLHRFSFIILAELVLVNYKMTTTLPQDGSIF